MCCPWLGGVAEALCGDVHWAENEKVGKRSSETVMGTDDYRCSLYMAHKKAKVKHTGCALLNGMDEPLISPLFMQEASDMPMDYCAMTVEKLYQLMTSLSWQKALEVEKIFMLWNRI